MSCLIIKIVGNGRRLLQFVLLVVHPDFLFVGGFVLPRQPVGFPNIPNVTTGRKVQAKLSSSFSSRDNINQ
jgi:hypothetical protein